MSNPDNTIDSEEPFGGIVINGYGIYTKSDQVALTNLIAQEANKACLKQLKKLWGHAREHTITDIEMIMHQTGGKVDFIEAVDTKYFEERHQELAAEKGKAA